MTIIRKPAVADTFYPADKKQLSQQLDGYLNQTKTITLLGKIKALIVPHAGIVFSGQTAAWGFKQLEGKKYQTIILLGASHTAWFGHAAVFDSGVWETPLGKLEIDQDLASNFIDKKTGIISDLNPHWREHDLEIELIFLQKVLKKFKILPILVSEVNEKLLQSLAKKISQHLDKKTLLVISSDLSHYPPWEGANQVDSQTIKAILTGNKKVFEEKIQSLENKNYPGLETAACGFQAIRVGLRTSEILNLRWQKIKYQNSGDVSGDKSRVVGYTSIIGFK